MTGNTTEAGGRMTEKEHIVESLGLLGKDRDELRECVIAMSHEAAMYKQERDALKASNAALVEALKVLEELYARDDESHVDRFERVAEMFYRETGCMAPGKDVSAAAGDSMSMEERRAKWDEWYARRVNKARAALASVKS